MKKKLESLQIQGKIGIAVDSPEHGYATVERSGANEFYFAGEKWDHAADSAEDMVDYLDKYNYTYIGLEQIY